jgi:glutamyl-tRNA(Gln) amidotransferase subunit E
MTEKIDYGALGFKCGLEIHQQLDTTKLFCSCPSMINDADPDFNIRRRMRAVAGESGDIDLAASHEMSKEKYFIYEGYYDSTCLVELDEEPPHHLNPAALYTVLQVSKMLNAHINDEIFVMRKTVVDGSNTSGFQRTALVATNGYLEVQGKRISIPTVCVEEDAARIIKKDTGFTVYRLDRLGIPLVEIATGPEIRSGEECREIAEYLGMILRSTGRVKRGLGTIRQDVNVSIAGGTRIEIKGAQDLRLLPLLVDYEILRQKNLLDLKSHLETHKIHFHKEKMHMSELQHLFERTDCRIIQQKRSVFGFKLEGFAGILGRELQPGRRVGTELSDYGKSQGLSGLFHSDEELEKYKINEKEIAAVKVALQCKPDDAFVLIAEALDTAEKAFSVILERICQLYVGVPKEVRNANEDGTSSFMRPMPGSARMYPETDVYSIIPDISTVSLPELLSEKIARFQQQYGLSKELASIMVKKGIPFEEYLQKYPNLKSSFIAEFFYGTPQELKKRHNIDYDPETVADELFDRLNSGRLAKSAIEEILVKKAKGEIINYDYFAPLDDETLENLIEDIIMRNKNTPLNAIMGIVMKEVKGRAEGKKINEILHRLMRTD